jgi:hypothetical protein
MDLMMPTPEARAERAQEKTRETIARRRLLANRKAFYALAAVLLAGLAFFGFTVSMH